MGYHKIQNTPQLISKNRYTPLHKTLIKTQNKFRYKFTTNSMFLAKTPKAGLIKAAVGAIAGIDGARTALLELLPNAMLFRVTHSTHNIIAVLKLKSEGFYYYSCNRSYFVDLNIGELFFILSQANDDDILTLSGHDPTTKILIKFEKRGQYKQTSIRATETINEHWTTDESAYQFYVALPSADFREKFKLFKQFDEFVKITLTEKMVKFKAGLLAVILNKEAGECMIEGIRGDVNCKVLVPLTHLDAILKGSSISSAVYIYDSLAVPSLRPLISCSLLGSFGSIMFFLPCPFSIFPPRI